MSILSQQKQSVNTDFPNLRPSLDLRFALAKKLDPRITFTRGSTGTYFGPDGFIKTAGVNEPRFDHDPVTGQSLGLLIEESRQNLLTWSEDFSNAAWTKSNFTIQSNVITAPDGSSNADKLIENTTKTVAHFALQASSATSGLTYTFSVFVKAAERTFAQVGLLNTNSPFDNLIAYVNLNTGSISSSTFGTVSGVNVSSVFYGNGWYRIIVTGIIGSATSLQGVIWTATSGAVSSAARTYTGDGTSGIYIWGTQLEEGAFPTSYIPTAASTVTRSADKPNILDISSFFNSTEGTLVVDSEMPYQTLNKFPAVGFTRSGGGSLNTIQFYYHNTSTPYATFLVRNFAAAGGGGKLAANLIEIPSPNQTVGSYKKFVGTYKFGKLNYYFDGKFVSKTNTNKALPTNLTYMEIGTHAATDNRLNGHIRRITYYPIALTNQQLINLSS